MYPIFGPPGPQTVTRFTHKYVFRNGACGFFPRGGYIDTAKTRDITNTLAPLLLSPGLLMGKITATGYWANSILGVSQSSYTSGGTSLTVTAAQAVEIARRVGTSGSLIFVGPPTANGTAAVVTQNFSAINTGTGVITITSLGVNMVAGSFVLPTDGSGVPLSIIEDGYGHTMGTSTDNLPTLSEWPRIPVEGMIEVGQVVNYPTDTGLMAWIRESMNRSGGGRFIFSDRF